MKKIHLVLLFIIAMMISWSSCAIFDDSLPEIEIIMPGEMESVVAGDTIVLNARIKHRKDIDWIEITFDHPSFSPIKIEDPETNDYLLNIDIALDRYLSRGTYKFTIEASANSISSEEMVQIDVSESNYKLNHYLVLLENSQNKMEVIKLDTNMNQHLLGTIDAEYHQAVMNNYKQQLIVSTAYDGVKSYDPYTGQQNWELNPCSAGNSIKSLASAGGYTAASCDPDYYSIINKSGIIINKIYCEQGWRSDLVHIKPWYAGTLVTAEEKNVSYYATSYNMANGNKNSQYLAESRLEAIVSTGNEDVFFIYSSTSNTHICNIGFWAVSSIKYFGGTYKSSCPGPDDFMIVATSSKLVRYNPDNYDYYILQSGQADHVAYDPANNNVIYTKGKTLYVMDIETETNLDNVSFNKKILGVFCVNNK